MKGYKATNANMTCREFQFDLDREFVHIGEIEPCYSGFHFCSELQHVFRYYDEPDTRVFEIEATGTIKTHTKKCVTNKIKFIREIPIEEIYEQCQDKWVVRRIAAYRQYKLDALINDPSWIVRREVIRRGYGLDILIKDTDWLVRAVATYQLDNAKLYQPTSL